MSESKILSQYGCYTFNDDVMRERLPKSTYKAFHESLKKGETLSKECASMRQRIDFQCTKKITQNINNKNFFILRHISGKNTVDFCVQIFYNKS